MKRLHRLSLFVSYPIHSFRIHRNFIDLAPRGRSSEHFSIWISSWHLHWEKTIWKKAWYMEHVLFFPDEDPFLSLSRATLWPQFICESRGVTQIRRIVSALTTDARGWFLYEHLVTFSCRNSMKSEPSENAYKVRFHPNRFNRIDIATMAATLINLSPRITIRVPQEFIWCVEVCYNYNMSFFRYQEKKKFCDLCY